MTQRNDLDHLAYLLGSDRKEVQNLLRNASLDPELTDTARNFLRTRVTKEGGDPDDSAAFPLVRQLPPGLMRLGPVWNGRQEGPVFAIPEATKANVQHVALVGVTRSGKSWILLHIGRQYMDAGGDCWVFDVEDEYSELVSAVAEPHKPIALLPRDLRVCFFQPPCAAVSIKTWLGDICLLLRQQAFLRDGSLNLFSAHMLQLVKRKHQTCGPDQFPSLAEALECFANLKLGGAKVRTNTWLESLLNRLQMLCDTFEETSHVTASNMLQQLADRSVIFRLRGFRGIPLQSLADYLMIWLTRYKEAQ
jgi:hypothetical protein